MAVSNVLVSVSVVFIMSLMSNWPDHPGEVCDPPAGHTCEACGAEVFMPWDSYEPKAVMVDDLPYCSRECAMLDETSDYDAGGNA